MKRRRSRILFALVMGLMAGAVAAAPVSSPGTNTGPIPDNNPASGRVVSFAVSGITVPVSSVELSMELNHAWAGDLTATLVAPGGVAQMVVFGRLGTGLGGTIAANFGDSSNFGAVYTFSDNGRIDLPQALAALLSSNDVLPTGRFRTLSRSVPGRSNAGGCPTSLRGVFGGLSPAQANGVWNLVLTDSGAGDTGSITAATLTLNAITDEVFANGFEPGSAPAAPAPNCLNKVQGDFTGDGLTDFALARNLGGAIQWSIRENLRNGTASTTETTFNLGNPATDFIDSLDLDGDRIADPAVWTPGAAESGVFRVRMSSRGGALREVVFGQAGDDPTQSGDYDGDGIDDLAVLRAPAPGTPAGPMVVRFLRSSDGGVGTVTIGTGNQNSAFAISGFDYNGDRRADAVLQQADAVTPGSARFRKFNGLAGNVFADFLFGAPSDFLVPGSHVGSPWADVTTSRSVAGVLEWRTRDSETGAETPLVTFGITGDTRIGGDYDGDLVTDHAVFRPTASPGPIAFFIRRSTDVNNLWTIVVGQANDYPIANSRVK